MARGHDRADKTPDHPQVPDVGAVPFLSEDPLPPGMYCAPRYMRTYTMYEVHDHHNIRVYTCGWRMIRCVCIAG